MKGGIGMYDRRAHERVTEAAMKVMSERAPVRLGGRPYEADDPFIFINPRCSETVIEALQTLCPLKWDRLADVTIGIGAGFSNMGEVCGALSGGIIAIGLDVAARYRDTIPLRLHIIRFTQKLMRDFTKEFGSVRCRDIIDCDISGTLIPGDEACMEHQKEFMKAKDEGVETVCFKLSRWVMMYPLPSEQEELFPPLL
jgi:C_GCAxxG_C_C family probable redox protein